MLPVRVFRGFSFSSVVDFSVVDRSVATPPVVVASMVRWSGPAGAPWSSPPILPWPLFNFLIKSLGRLGALWQRQASIRRKPSCSRLLDKFEQVSPFELAKSHW